MSTPSALEKQPLLATPEPEPSLSELQQNVVEAQRKYMRAWSKTTNGRCHKTIMLAVTILLSAMLILCSTIVLEDSLDDEPPFLRSTKVPLEAHIMSKCPDARDCLHDMILPAMMNVSSKVDFKLSYIGRYGINPLHSITNSSSTTDHDDGVLCKHGPQECLGNIIELCAEKLYRDPKIYLGFTMCLSRDFHDIPQQELIEDCALEHGISIAELNACAVDEDGAPSVEMLQKSFQRSADAGVSISCTVRVEEEVFCIRDDGQWKECPNGSKASDLIHEIEKRYKARQLRASRDW